MQGPLSSLLLAVVTAFFFANSIGVADQDIQLTGDVGLRNRTASKSLDDTWRNTAGRATASASSLRMQFDHTIKTES